MKNKSTRMGVNKECLGVFGTKDCEGECSPRVVTTASDKMAQLMDESSDNITRLTDESPLYANCQYPLPKSGREVFWRGCHKCGHNLVHSPPYLCDDCLSRPSLHKQVALKSQERDGTGRHGQYQHHVLNNQVALESQERDGTGRHGHYHTDGLYPQIQEEAVVERKTAKKRAHKPTNCTTASKLTSYTTASKLSNSTSASKLTNCNVEEVGAVLSKAEKKKLKKQRQKDRHDFIQQVGGKKCEVEGCTFITVPSYQPESYDPQLELDWQEHSMNTHWLAVHYYQQTPPPPSNVLGEPAPIGHSKIASELAGLHVQVQEESGVDLTKQAEGAGDILTKLAKKRAKKQRQKIRDGKSVSPAPGYSGEEQCGHQEQLTPATMRLFTKCYVEGCVYDTSHELGEEQVPQELHDKLLVRHLQVAHKSWEGTSPYKTQPPQPPSNAGEPVGHATHAPEPAGQLPVEIEQESAGHAIKEVASESVEHATTNASENSELLQQQPPDDGGDNAEELNNAVPNASENQEVLLQPPPDDGGDNTEELSNVVPNASETPEVLLQPPPDGGGDNTEELNNVVPNASENPEVLQQLPPDGGGENAEELTNVVPFPTEASENPEVFQQPPPDGGGDNAEELNNVVPIPTEAQNHNPGDTTTDPHNQEEGLVPTGDNYYTLKQRGETEYGCEQLLVYDESQELGMVSKKTEQHSTAVNKNREILNPEAITEDEVANIPHLSFDIERDKYVQVVEAVESEIMEVDTLENDVEVKATEAATLSPVVPEVEE